MTKWDICFLLIFIFLGPLIGGLLEGLDRKISARLQGRVGPPILQPFYDLQKLMDKQVVAVVEDKSMFALLLAYLIMMIFSGAIFFAGNDILMSVFVLSTSTAFLYFASNVSSSPMATMAAERELVQQMTYEPAVLLTCVGFYLAGGTFRVGELATQGQIMLLKTPGFFLAFVFILLIKLRKSPFDLSTGEHAHQELVQGIKTEMGSRNLAIFIVAEWYEHTYLYGMLALFTITKSPWSFLLTAVVLSLVFLVLTLIDNASARVKMRDMIRLGWEVTLLGSGLNLLVLLIR